MPLCLRLPFRNSAKRRKARPNLSSTVSSTSKEDGQPTTSEPTLSRPNSVPTPSVTHDNLWERAEKDLRKDKKGEELLQEDGQPTISEPTLSRPKSVPTPPVTHDNLWERAEKDLRKDKKREELLQEATQILKDWGLNIQLSGGDGYKKLCSFLEVQTSELKEKEWMIGDQNVSVRDKVTKVMRNILVVKDVINTAATASPPAAIACAAMTVSLLLFIQAVEQREVLLQGLDKTSAIILRIHKMDDLYLHLNETSDDFIEKFEETLTSLCCKLLEFQARALCYLQKNSFVQFSRGMLKRDPWDSLLKDMQDLENEARKFISLIEADELKSERERREGELQSALERHQIWQTTSKRNQTLKGFFQRLYTCPYRDRKDRNSPRVPETCEWFTSHPRFRKWNESPEAGLLWVSADPGCGKSVLAKYLVDEVLPKPRGRTVCYFFFKDDFDDQRSSTSALCSLLRQVLMAQPSLLPQSALDKFETDGDKLIESFRDLWNILISASSNPQAGEIIFVVDALDECQDADRSQLIEEVTRFYLNNSQGHNIKFLMTSRPYGHIRSAFQNLERETPAIHLNAENEVEVDKISREIDLVVASRVCELADRKSLEPSEHTFLQEQLTSIQHRTYLWVTLTMEYIEKTPGFTKGNVRRTMGAEIPTSVNDAYSKILNRSPNHIKARRLLHIILAAKRPLLVEELSLASAVQKVDQPADEVKDDIEIVERFKDTIRDLCGLLLVIIEGKVYLLHQTVKEFLVHTPSSGSISAFHTWQHSLEPMESSKVLAEVCIWVLFTHSETSQKDFWDYSVEYWMVHLRESCSYKGDKLTELGALLCSPWTTGGRRVYEHWEQVWISCPKDPSPLIVASCLGLEGVVELLLGSEETDISSKDSAYGRTPLSWAARQGHEGVVKLLLQTGQVDIDSKDEDQRTPLSWAARNGHEAMVKLLFQTGQVDIDSKDEDQRTPLSWAAGNGHEAVVKLLFQTGQVDIDSKDEDQRTPLSWAAGNGHEAVVKLLFQTGQVDIDSKDFYQQTPLSWAARHGHETVVKLLFQTGQVDVDSKDSYQRTPLSWAARHGYEAIVKLLLQTGQVDIDSKNENQQTPLSWAAGYGHEAVVKLLLQTRQVDVNSKDSDQQTPLSWAASAGSEAVVKLLLQTGQVDIDSKDSHQQTPLSWAARTGSGSVVKLLLQTGQVDIDSKDLYERTPLSWAAERGHEAVVKLLLQTGQVDIDSKDLDQRTPLSRAAQHGHEAVVKLLLQTGQVDIDSKDSKQRTPLSWAAKRGYHPVVNLLLQTGQVDIDSKDSNGVTPLFRAAAKGHERVVKLLSDASTRVKMGEPAVALI
ncbi:hypothetical protein N7466_004102 [Penicillium verhagenii]|uniref:uncharacterized protein n=1 Tax=Penicillium verhagenii TaxID=1562060 RepID=UPI0025458055|nr:uncharacterized protein N7466_004102 [Penicillium verhagenii]KAJ5934555.1 hypothetical protein N7466_004102 [Penicillium verhagenii]